LARANTLGEKACMRPVLGYRYIKYFKSEGGSDLFKRIHLNLMLRTHWLQCDSKLCFYNV
jgi:hypothetical protein